MTPACSPFGMPCAQKKTVRCDEKGDRHKKKREERKRKQQTFSSMMRVRRVSDPSFTISTYVRAKAEEGVRMSFKSFSAFPISRLTADTNLFQREGQSFILTAQGRIRKKERKKERDFSGATGGGGGGCEVFAWNLGSMRTGISRKMALIPMISRSICSAPTSEICLHRKMC